MLQLYFSLNNIFLKKDTKTSFIFPQHSILSGEIQKVSLNMNFQNDFEYNLVLYNKNGEQKYKTITNNENFPPGSNISIGDILEINILSNTNTNTIEFINVTIDIENTDTLINTFESNNTLNFDQKFNVPNNTYLHNILCVIKCENNKNFRYYLEILDIFDKPIYNTEIVNVVGGNCYNAFLFKIKSKAKVNSGYYIKINLTDNTIKGIIKAKLMCTFSNKENYTIIPTSTPKPKPVNNIKKYKLFLTTLFSIFILVLLFSVNN